MFRFTLLLSMLVFAVCASADTEMDQLIGVRVGQKLTQDILAAPPLPSLGGPGAKSSTRVTPLVSYVSVTAENTDTSPENSYGPYRGSFKGYTAALGLTRDSQSAWSFYGFASFSQVSGEMYQLSASDLSQSSLAIKDMKASNVSVSGGVNYRLLGSKQSPAAVGLLAGPFVSRTSSTLTYINQSGSGTEDQYKADTLVFGPMVGIQALAQAYGFTANPYFLYYLNVLDTCQTFETDSTTTQVTSDATGSCNAANREIEVEGTFYAYGLNVGYGGFSFNVIGKSGENSSFSSIKTKMYTLAYTFNF